MLIYITRTLPSELAKHISNLAMALFSGLGFLLGAMASAFSGYAGMWVSVRSNSRVASAAGRDYNEAMQTI